MCIVHSPRTKRSSIEKINDLVMIDSCSLINWMDSGEAWTDLCNECLLKVSEEPGQRFFMRS